MQLISLKNFHIFKDLNPKPKKRSNVETLLGFSLNRLICFKLRKILREMRKIIPDSQTRFLRKFFKNLILLKARFAPLKDHQSCIQQTFVCKKILLNHSACQRHFVMDYIFISATTPATKPKSLDFKNSILKFKFANFAKKVEMKLKKKYYCLPLT